MVRHRQTVTSPNPGALGVLLGSPSQKPDTKGQQQPGQKAELHQVGQHLQQGLHSPIKHRYRDRHHNNQSPHAYALLNAWGQ